MTTAVNTTNEVVGEVDKHPSRIARLWRRLRPKPLEIVRDRAAGTTRLLVQTADGSAEWAMINNPLVYPKGAGFIANVRHGGQFLHKSAFGYILNGLGLALASTIFYVIWQNPWTAAAYDNPAILWYGLLHLLHRTTEAAPHTWTGLWTWVQFKHYVLRDAMEYNFRGALAWVAFTSVLNIARQVGKHGPVVKLIAKLRLIPTEAQGHTTRWWQVPFVPFGMYFLPIPLMSIPFVGIMLFTLHNPPLRDVLLANTAKYTGILGGLLVTRYVVDKLAADMQHVFVDVLHDMGIKPRWPWVPAPVRALYYSPLRRPVPGSQAWLIAGLALFAVVLLVGAYTGVWIHNNVPWLHDHTLFSQEGWYRLTHAVGIKHWWLK